MTAKDTISGERKQIRGEVMSEGISMGHIFVFKDLLSWELIAYSIAEDDVLAEKERVNKAIEKVLEEIYDIKEKSRETMEKKYTEIFDSHIQILQDQKVQEEISDELHRELINAEQAVKNVFNRWADRLRKSENERTRSTADDLHDLSRRILNYLIGYEHHRLEKLPTDSIVAAQRLMPSDTIHLKRRNLKGIIVNSGSVNSHSAILARTLGVPALCNPDGDVTEIPEKTPVILNAYEGKAVLNPHTEDVDAYHRKSSEMDEKELVYLRNATMETRTRDGTKIRVFANASTTEDFRIAVQYGCDGIGLFRIEHIYLGAETMPGQQQLETWLDSVLTHAGDREVTLRLLDIGGDKRLPYLKMKEEYSPMLGLRGIRVLLENETLLRTQIRAILNLSKKYNLRLMIPMVTLPEEIRRTRNIVREESGKQEPDLPVGAMIETPAAVFTIQQIIRESDFLSIGTNDLIQYTMVAGRENPDVRVYYEKGIKTILDAIRSIIQATDPEGIECSICGEIAADIHLTEKLLNTGIRYISVSPHIIPRLKKEIRELKLSGESNCGQ